MGAANSREPRSVSMDNPSGVIDVSEEVVQRLKKGISKQAAKNPTETTPPSPSPKKEKRQVTPKAVAPTTPTPKVIYHAPPAVYMAPGGTTLTAADMLREKETELKQNDAMWRQRMVDLEQTLKKTNAIMEKEYSTAVDDVRQRFATAAPAHQLPPCQDLKAKLVACYRANPGETLRCATEVAAFRECVSNHRIQKVDAEAATTKPAKGA